MYFVRVFAAGDYNPRIAGIQKQVRKDQFKDYEVRYLWTRLLSWGTVNAHVFRGG